jgi:hypothetical protein
MKATYGMDALIYRLCSASLAQKTLAGYSELESIFSKLGANAYSKGLWLGENVVAICFDCKIIDTHLHVKEGLEILNSTECY